MLERWCQGKNLLVIGIWITDDLFVERENGSRGELSKVAQQDRN
jgi:hypothetical protein